MTEPIKGQENEQDEKVEFSETQQEFLNKMLRRERIVIEERVRAAAEKDQEAATEKAKLDALAAEKKWRELAEHHEGRVLELEHFEVDAKAYRELITGMLKDRIKVLGKAAEKAVKALPEGMKDIDKLTWLNAMAEEWFETDARKIPGTPAAKLKKAAGKSERPEGYHRSRL